MIIIVFMILIAVALLCLGPIGFVIAMSAYKKSKRNEWHIQQLYKWNEESVESQQAADEEMFEDMAGVALEEVEQQEQPKEEILAPGNMALPFEDEKVAGATDVAANVTKAEDVVPLSTVAKSAYKPESSSINRESSKVDEEMSIEQKLGIKGALVAGVVTVIVGVAFFLKYAYDNALIGELGRVVIAALCGIAALGVGEITRRKGFSLVARGVTALGFATLYASVFAAFRFYSLIDMWPAITIAIFITAFAMLYASVLNEQLIAVLSLVGGFLSPMIINSGENLPGALFSYILVLGLGVMVCSVYRKWRHMNLLAFVGTVMVYAIWHDEFYRIMLKDAGAAGTFPVAIGWLAVFFFVYLVTPLVHGFVWGKKTNTSEIVLLFANATFVFVYLCAMLYRDYRVALAISSASLAVVHFALVPIAFWRSRDDRYLQTSLICLGVAFFTIALPLYLEFYQLSVAWSAEGAVLVYLGVRFRNRLLEAAGAIAMILSVNQLGNSLPIHGEDFRLLFNPQFGSWAFVAVSLLACHIVYRRLSKAESGKATLAEVYYIASVVILIISLFAEWNGFVGHRFENVNQITIFRTYGFIAITTLLLLLLSIRPLCPKGPLCMIGSWGVAVIGAVYVWSAQPDLYQGEKFVLFFNNGFAMLLVFVAGLFAVFLNLRKFRKETTERTVSNANGLVGMILLWMLMTSQIFLFWKLDGRENWRFLGHMYISVMWAVYACVLMVGGFWKKVSVLRYLSLGLFAILLIKVFVVDTSNIKNVYRIAAFLVTGLSLVGVSYIYVFLRGKGFFKTLNEASEETVG